MPTNIKLNFSKKVFQDAISTNINAALTEDLGKIDKTSQLISKNELGFATIKANQSAILCGSPWVNSCFIGNRGYPYKWCYLALDVLFGFSYSICFIRILYDSFSKFKKRIWKILRKNYKDRRGYTFNNWFSNYH